MSERYPKSVPVSPDNPAIEKDGTSVRIAAIAWPYAQKK